MARLYRLTINSENLSTPIVEKNTAQKVFFRGDIYASFLTSQIEKEQKKTYWFCL